MDEPPWKKLFSQESESGEVVSSGYETRRKTGTSRGKTGGRGMRFVYGFGLRRGAIRGQSSTGGIRDRVAKEMRKVRRTSAVSSRTKGTSGKVWKVFNRMKTLKISSWIGRWFNQGWQSCFPSFGSWVWTIFNQKIERENFSVLSTNTKPPTWVQKKFEKLRLTMKAILRECRHVERVLENLRAEKMMLYKSENMYDMQGSERAQGTL